MNKKIEIHYTILYLTCVCVWCVKVVWISVLVCSSMTFDIDIMQTMCMAYSHSNAMYIPPHINVVTALSNV